MTAHIGVDAEPGRVHPVKGTAGNVNDVVKTNSSLHGTEAGVFAYAGYHGVGNLPDAKTGMNWHIATCPGKRKAPGPPQPLDGVID